MRQLHGSQANLRRSNPLHSKPVSFTRSMVSVAVLPRRYYVLPITIEALYFTTTALPRWIERHQRMPGAGAQSAQRPMPTLVSAVVVAFVGKEILRAAAVGAKKLAPRSH